MSDKINVFIKLDMNGVGSKAFYVSKSKSIKDLKQMCDDREGIEVDILYFRGRPLKDDLKLNDYATYNNCNLFASLRLLGGAQVEGSNATKFNEFEVAKIAAKHGATVTTETCAIYASTGCSEIMIKKIKYSCGCIFCPDCMKLTINRQADYSTATSLFCGSSNCGTKAGGTSKGKPIDAALAFAVCAFSDIEKAAIDAKLDANAFKQSTSMMSICCNDKCKKFLVKKKNDATLVEKCIHCNTEICWVCKEAKHNNPMDCGPVATIQAMLNSPDACTKTVDGVDNVWNKRVCPNKKCHAVNKHKSACRHMTCNCGYQYCHICLKPWIGHGPRFGCNDQLKPKETPTVKSLYYD